MKTTDIDKFAKNLIEGIDSTKRKARQNEKATDTYWNGDGWGSISGIRDAENWVNNQVIRYVAGQLKKFKKET